MYEFNRMSDILTKLGTTSQSGLYLLQQDYNQGLIRGGARWVTWVEDFKWDHFHR